MLVLSRKLNQSIIINGNIRVSVVGMHGNQVRIGIEAPTQIPILREELCCTEAHPYLEPVPHEMAVVGSIQQAVATKPT